MAAFDERTTGSHRHLPIRLGGFAAIAETAWMGSVQGTEVIEPINLARRLGQRPAPRPPGARIQTLLTRELTVRQASFALMASFFVSALLGAIRQILFNVEFGASLEADAYYAAFRLPDLLFSLIAGGALSSAMIPVLLGVARQDGDDAARHLTSEILTALLLVFAVVVAAAEIFTPVFVQSILAPGFDPETSRLTVSITRIMLIQPLILVVGSVATAVLNGRNQFLLTAVSIASHNVALILGILATHFLPQLGIYGPTLGVVGGAVLQALILLPGLRATGFHFQLTLNLADRSLGQVIRLLIPNGLAVGVLYLGSIVDTAFASVVPQAAALPAITNAWLLVGLPIALLGQAIGQSAFPRLAGYATDANWPLFRHWILRALGTAVGLSIPSGVGLILTGQTIIHVIFVHGKYDDTAGALTYGVLEAYAIALPAYVASEVVTRGLIALQDTRTPLLTNTGQIIARATIMAVLIRPVGVLAIPTALAIAASVETLGLGTMLWIRIRRRIQKSSVPPAPIETGR